jgi:hypothetical protein
VEWNLQKRIVSTENSAHSVRQKRKSHLNSICAIAIFYALVGEKLPLRFIRKKILAFNPHPYEGSLQEP